MEGYIREYRKIMQWRWYRDIAVAHLFRHLILSANYITADWQDITISRGQLVTSRLRLAYETGLTEKVVRRCLKVLEKTGEIHLQSSSRYTLITICKYSEYQGDKNVNGQLRTNKGPIEGQLGAINNKREQCKNIESSPSEDSSSVQAPTQADERIDYQAFMTFFNEAMAGKVIPQIAKITKKRQGMLNARVKEHGKDAVAVAIRKAANSSWLNGGGGKFHASFDWIFKPDNFIKVLEGNYDDQLVLTPTSTDSTSFSQVQTNYKYTSYEEHRNNEQQKRLDCYADAVAETLNRS